MGFPIDDDCAQTPRASSCYRFGQTGAAATNKFPTLVAALLVAVSAAAAVPSIAGVPPPRLGIQNLSDISVPARPFDQGADADSDVERAVAQARKQNKRLLIDLGANWCADCRVLSAIMEMPDVRRFLDGHYVVVVVDVGHLDRNLEIPARFGLGGRLEGVPAVLIAEPDGELVNRGHTAALLDAGRMTPQAIADWLASWAR
jgi:thiol:disulfide interchange protein